MLYHAWGKLTEEMCCQLQSRIKTSHLTLTHKGCPKFDEGIDLISMCIYVACESMCTHVGSVLMCIHVAITSMCIHVAMQCIHVYSCSQCIHVYPRVFV